MVPRKRFVPAANKAAGLFYFERVKNSGYPLCDGEVVHVASGMELGKWSVHCFFFGKRADVLQHIGDLAENKTGFAHVALEAAFSKVCLQGGIDLLLVGLDGGLQLFQGINAKINV